MSTPDSDTNEDQFTPWASRRKLRADLKRGRVLCPAKAKPKQRVDCKTVFKNIERWIVDTGSGLDLVAYSDIVHVAQNMEEAKIPVNFNTANGSAPADMVLKATMPFLKEEIQPYVLENTPCSLICRLAVQTIRLRIPLVRVQGALLGDSAPEGVCTRGHR